MNIHTLSLPLGDDFSWQDGLRNLLASLGIVYAQKRSDEPLKKRICQCLLKSNDGSNSMLNSPSHCFPERVEMQRNVKGIRAIFQKLRGTAITPEQWENLVYRIYEVCSMVVMNIEMDERGDLAEKISAIKRDVSSNNEQRVSAIDQFIGVLEEVTGISESSDKYQYSDFYQRGILQRARIFGPAMIKFWACVNLSYDVEFVSLVNGEDYDDTEAGRKTVNLEDSDNEKESDDDDGDGDGDDMDEYESQKKTKIDDAKTNLLEIALNNDFTDNYLDISTPGSLMHGYIEPPSDVYIFKSVDTNDNFTFQTAGGNAEVVLDKVLEIIRDDFGLSLAQMTAIDKKLLGSMCEKKYLNTESLAGFMYAANQKQIPVRYHSVIFKLMEMKVDGLTALNIVSAGCLYLSPIELTIRLQQIFSGSNGSRIQAFAGTISFDDWVPLERGRMLAVYDFQIKKINDMIQEEKRDDALKNAGKTDEMDNFLKIYKEDVQNKRRRSPVHKCNFQLTPAAETVLWNEYEARLGAMKLLRDNISDYFLFKDLHAHDADSEKAEFMELLDNALYDQKMNNLTLQMGLLEAEEKNLITKRENFKGGSNSEDENAAEVRMGELGQQIKSLKSEMEIYTKYKEGVHELWVGNVLVGKSSDLKEAVCRELRASLEDEITLRCSKRILHLLLSNDGDVEMNTDAIAAEDDGELFSKYDEAVGDAVVVYKNQDTASILEDVIESRSDFVKFMESVVHFYTSKNGVMDRLREFGTLIDTLSDFQNTVYFDAYAKKTCAKHGDKLVKLLQLVLTVTAQATHGIKVDPEITKRSTDEESDEWKKVYSSKISSFLPKKDIARIQDAMKQLRRFRLFFNEIYAAEGSEEQDIGTKRRAIHTFNSLLEYTDTVWDSLRMRQDQLSNHLRLRRFMEGGLITSYDNTKLNGVGDSDELYTVFSVVREWINVERSRLAIFIQDEHRDNRRYNMSSAQDFLKSSEIISYINKNHGDMTQLCEKSEECYQEYKKLDTRRQKSEEQSFGDADRGFLENMEKEYENRYGVCFNVYDADKYERALRFLHIDVQNRIASKAAKDAVEDEAVEKQLKEAADKALKEAEENALKEAEEKALKAAAEQKELEDAGNTVEGTKRKGVYVKKIDKTKVKKKAKKAELKAIRERRLAEGLNKNEHDMDSIGILVSKYLEKMNNRSLDYALYDELLECMEDLENGQNDFETRLTSKPVDDGMNDNINSLKWFVSEIDARIEHIVSASRSDDDQLKVTMAHMELQTHAKSLLRRYDEIDENLRVDVGVSFNKHDESKMSAELLNLATAIAQNASIEIDNQLVSDKQYETIMNAMDEALLKDANYHETQSAAPEFEELGGKLSLLVMQIAIMQKRMAAAGPSSQEDGVGKSANDLFEEQAGHIYLNVVKAVGIIKSCLLLGIDGDHHKTPERTLYLLHELADVIRGCICVNLTGWTVKRDKTPSFADMKRMLKHGLKFLFRSAGKLLNHEQSHQRDTMLIQCVTGVCQQLHEYSTVKRAAHATVKYEISGFIQKISRKYLVGLDFVFVRDVISRVASSENPVKQFSKNVKNMQFSNAVGVEVRILNFKQKVIRNAVQRVLLDELLNKQGKVDARDTRVSKEGQTIKNNLAMLDDLASEMQKAQDMMEAFRSSGWE